MAQPIIYAKLKNFDQPPRKVRLVIDEIRGLDASDAITRLEFLKKKAAPIIKKVVESAVANATNNAGLEKANLYIKEARVDEGIVRKKPYYRGRGGIDMVSKRYSHIIIGLAEKENIT